MQCLCQIHFVRKEVRKVRMTNGLLSLSYGENVYVKVDFDIFGIFFHAKMRLLLKLAATYCVNLPDKRSVKTALPIAKFLILNVTADYDESRTILD